MADSFIRTDVRGVRSERNRARSSEFEAGSVWTSGYYGYGTDYLAMWCAWVSLAVHTWCFFRLFPKARRPVLRLILGNALVFLCLLGLTGLAAESYLRFVSTSTDAYGATLTCKRWHAAFATNNSLGHRDHEWTETKPAGVRRIAFLGDSFTYGWGINNPEDRFTSLLQKRWNEAAPGTVEVMNVAWGGWDTRAQIRELRRIAPQYSIDEVVLCYVPNDIERVLPVRPEFDPTEPPKSSIIRTDQSFLLDYLFYRVYAPRLASQRGYLDWLADGFERAETWQSHLADLQHLMDYCASERIRLSVVLLPFLRTAGTRFHAEAVHEKLRNAFERQGVPVIDLGGIAVDFPSAELVVNAHDPHPNERAHRLFADAIEKGLRGRGHFGE